VYEKKGLRRIFGTKKERKKERKEERLNNYGGCYVKITCQLVDLVLYNQIKKVTTSGHAA
jgi:hypothetical protein